jgi:phosphoribosylaminoimidazole synthetase
VDTAAAVVGGIAKGCELSGCALIGGETAEMPGMYPAGEYDLAGFAVGAVEKSKILTGAQVQPGDVVLGLASGVHSNGFSLVRKCIDRAQAAGSFLHTLDGRPFRQALMEPTRLYVKSVLAALAPPDQGTGAHHRRWFAGKHSAGVARWHAAHLAKAAGRRLNCLPGCKQPPELMTLR